MCITPFIVPVTTFAVFETVVSTTVTAVEQLWVKIENKNNIAKFLKKVFILKLYFRNQLIKILSLLTSFSRNLLLFEKIFQYLDLIYRFQFL